MSFVEQFSLILAIISGLASFFLVDKMIVEANSVMLSSPRKNSPLNINPQVWLSVSSKPERQLVLNWHRVDRHDLYNSWIGLYDIEPNGFNFDYAFIDRVFPNAISGKYITSKQYEYFSFQSAFNHKSKRYLSDFLHSRNDSALTPLTSSLWSGCVKYWIAYIKYNKRIVVKKCLRTRPRWMEESMAQIGDRSLLEMALPGTHNAGSYENPGRNGELSRFKKYIYCQDESIWNQLVYGIRFLDLRVAFDKNAKNDRERIWIAHGVAVVDVALVDVLEQVLAFILSTHQEIVVLDFHRFEEGLQESLPDINQRHSTIEKLIYDYLGVFMITAELGAQTPIRELVALNKRVLIGYASDHRNRAFFHTNALHVWPGTDDRNKLFRYLNERSCRSPSAPYLVSLMGALTPKFFGLLRDKYDGLRNLAEQINFDLSVNVFEDWWQCMNVLATDYFLGNNIIEFTIEANLQKEENMRRKNSLK